MSDLCAPIGSPRKNKNLNVQKILYGPRRSKIIFYADFTPPEALGTFLDRDV
jgi:hypothetical protein